MKIGILGAGNIAAKMATTLMKMKNTEAVLVAVASRSIDKSKEFAKKFGIEKAYGSYEDMLRDGEIGLIYVATPHSHHYEHVKLCLKYKKHVLCEKSFTVNAEQARELIDIAEKERLLLAEAIWTRYLPMQARLNELLSGGIIGDVTSLTANLGYRIENVPRLTDPALAGGALLDLGVYTINFALMCLGHGIEKISSGCIKTDTGVDSNNWISLEYFGGQTALLYSDMRSETDRRGVISGTKGRIEVQNINNIEAIDVYPADGQHIHIPTPPQITGFEYEILAAVEAAENGMTEVDEMPHSEIIYVMEMMDNLRKEWGIKYPFE